ncbi:ATP synthase F1 subcomplex delta subunit [Tindallia magadiensis]|uniref:ATP synthase subunit delta n=1 Tax=Tindallia magadiensis TaxID=69895 RepID=A0A1I3C3N9_9FIRM|nr:ATP synthase F1 subunit delta [Tindallia magadiensis]SFH69228.1 ATP synthase F1 subcomplex delta subunit [Tindallia magadiensis]
MAALVAAKYAKALFQAIQETESLEPAAALDQLDVIAASFDEVPKFYELYISPVVGDKEKKEMLETVFKGKLSPEIYHFLLILIDKQREMYFLEILSIFKKITDEHMKKLKATAITAVPLSEETFAKLQKTLGKLSGKEVELTNKVDESIIGGVQLRMGDKVIDGTLSRQLNLMKDELAQIIV